MANPKFVECATQADVDRVTGEGNIAVVRSGRFVAWGSSHVEAWGSSHVVAWESSHVVARESSHVEAWGSSHVEAWGSSHVVARGSSHVEARGSSHVEARESSHVVARESSHVEATPNVAVRRHSGAWDKPKITGGILLEVPKITTPQEWCDYYGVKVSRGIATVFKAVRDDFRSAHGMSYQPGSKPSAPDWDPVPECGGGLHFAFHPVAAFDFDRQATRFLACPVRLDEMVIHPDGSYPGKIKAPRVVGKGCVEVDRYGKRLAGQR